jgi:hypothetical protein
MAGSADEGAQFHHSLLQPAQPLGRRQREAEADMAAPVTVEAAVESGGISSPGVLRSIS